MLKLPRLLLALIVASCAAPALADITLSPSGMVQPLVGGSSNTWGATINTNYATINGWFTTGPALNIANGGTAATTAAAARTNLAVPGLATTNTFPLAQTFTAAPVFTDVAGSRTALGLGTSATINTGTSGATIPLLNGANGWSGKQAVGLHNNLTAASAYVSSESTDAGVYGGQFMASNGSSGQYGVMIRTDRVDGGFALFKYGATTVGSISTNSTSTAFNTTSDHRLKANVVPMGNALKRLELLRPVRFNWKANIGAPMVDGFIAHEVSAAVPEAVTGAKDAVDAQGKIIPQQVDYSKVVPLLVGSVQELDGKVRRLEAALSAALVLALGGILLAAYACLFVRPARSA